MQTKKEKYPHLKIQGSNVFGQNDIEEPLSLLYPYYWFYFEVPNQYHH